MSAFEHRSTDGKSRQTDITLVYGGHVAKGVLLENSQKISLGSNELKLDGELTLNYKTNRMTLDGPMYIDAQRFDIEEVLRCVDKTQTTSPGSSGH